MKLYEIRGRKFDRYVQIYKDFLNSNSDVQ